jgi:FkbM family methyltransferase
LIVASGERTVVVAGSKASFSVDTRAEFMRLKSMTERDIIGSVLSEIQPNDVFYDVGANVGVYSCLIGDKLSGGRVISFEPYPTNVKKLRKNIDENGTPADVYQVALSNQEDTVSLSVAVDSHLTAPGHNLIGLRDEVKEYGKNSTEQIAVRTTRGDKLVSEGQIPKPTVVKVDVEGAEFDVLTGLKDSLLSEDCRLIYCEVHRDHLPKFGATEAELHELLEDCGFKIEILEDHSSKYHLVARKHIN